MSRTPRLSPAGQGLAAVEPLNRFIEQAPAAIAMFDRDMRYLAASRRWAADYFPDRAELADALVGRSHYDLFPDLPQRWRHAHQAVMAGETLKAERDPHVRADGRVQYFDWEMQPWRDERGGVGGVVIFSREVSDAVAAESTLLEGFAASPIALLLVARDGVIESANRQAEILLGYAPAELVGQPVEVLVPPGVAGHQALREGFLANPQFRPMGGGLDLIAVRKDGAEVPVEIGLGPIRTRLGTTVLVSVNDLTVRKRLEAELRRERDASLEAQAALAESEQLLEAAFEQSGVGKVVLDLDRRIVRANAALCARSGFQASELIGRPAREFAHPDEVGLLAAQSGALFAGDIQSYARERRFRGKSGEWITFWSVTSVAWDSEGEPRFMVIELQDLTEEKAAKKAIEESEARYRLLADRSSDIILKAGTDGVIDYVSPASRQLGYAPEEMVGRKVLDFVDPQDRDPVQHRLAALLSPGPAAPTPAGGRFTVRVRTKAGEGLWLESSPSVLRDASDVPTGAITTLRDVTQRLALEAELKRKTIEAEAMAQAKSEFLANMSHEIRTPLTGVLGFTGLLEALPDLSPAARQFVGRIASSGQTLLAVVNDILDFSRLEAGQVELDPHPFALPPLLEAAMDLVRDRAAQKGLAVEVACEPADAPLWLVADDARLRQVLLNLLSNAVKFTEHGRIGLAARYDAGAGRLRVTVSDTGIGIAPEMAGRLFQRFSQVDGSSTRAHGGTGLGLAISKALIEAMGGSIGFDSAPGAGAAFWLEIPASPAEPEAEAAAAPETAPEAGRDADAPPVRVLVVDDVAANRELIAAILSPFDLEVVQADGGAAAVREAVLAHFDVILMDLQMPGMDGMATSRAIRANCDLNRSTPIIAVSANVLPEQVAAARAAGMDDHLAKPIAPAALLAKIAAVVDAA